MTRSSTSSTSVLSYFRIDTCPQSGLSTLSSVKNQEFKMDKTEADSVIKANLAAVEAHFHNEGLNEN